MSYTPTEWNKGDVITSQKLNKIEQGIVNSCEGKIAIVNLSATGFGSASRVFCRVVYATLENGSWVVVTDNDDLWTTVYGWADPSIRVLSPMIVPPGGTMYPFLVDVAGDELVITGDISNTPENIYFTYGSPIPGGGYRISGSGSIQFIAL